MAYFGHLETQRLQGNPEKKLTSQLFHIVH